MGGPEFLYIVLVDWFRAVFELDRDKPFPRHAMRAVPAGHYLMPILVDFLFGRPSTGVEAQR